MEDGDHRGNIDGRPQWNVDFREEDTCWYNYTVEEECQEVYCHFPYEEKTVDHIELLPY